MRRQAQATPLPRERHRVEDVIPVVRECKGMLAIAAKRLGISYETLRKYVHKYPTLAKVVQESREETTDMAELALYKKIQEGEGWAVCFYLKTQGKGRGYIERHEISGPDGGAVPVSFVEVVKGE